MSFSAQEFMSKFDRFGYGRITGFEQKTGKRHIKNDMMKSVHSANHHRDDLFSIHDYEDDENLDFQHEHERVRHDEPFRWIYWIPVNPDNITTFISEHTGKNFISRTKKDCQRTARQIAEEHGYSHIRPVRYGYSADSIIQNDRTFYVAKSTPELIFTLSDIIELCFFENGIEPHCVDDELKIRLGIRVKYELVDSGVDVDRLPRVRNPSGHLVIRYDMTHHQQICSIAADWMRENNLLPRQSRVANLGTRRP